MTTPRELANAVITDPRYTARWFDAADFFNTVYTSKILEGEYFITQDKFMTSDIWALRHITASGIETVLVGDTEQQCLDHLKELYCITC